MRFFYLIKNDKYKSFIQKILAIGITAIMFFAVFGFSGCEANRQFTNEEHIERITQRVQERFFAEGSDYPYTEFTVTILYSLSGNPDFFMVEFEPDGFFYGTIHRNEYYVVGDNFFRGSTRMGGGWTDWIPPSTRHYRSHFYVNGITDQSKYILPTGIPRQDFLYPMIRRGNYFLPLTGGGHRVHVDAEPYRNQTHRGIRITNLRW